MMYRPWACRASQHIVSASSDCTQIILSPLSLSPPTSSLSGKHPVVFTTLVILCFSVLTFSRRDRDYQISSPDPLLPALRLPFLPAVWEDHAGFLCHTSRLGSGYGCGACTCASCLRLALKSHWQALYRKKGLSFGLRFHCLCASIYLTCRTGGCSGTELSFLTAVYFCFASPQIFRRPCMSFWLLFNQQWNHYVLLGDHVPG